MAPETIPVFPTSRLFQPPIRIIAASLPPLHLYQASIDVALNEYIYKDITLSTRNRET